VKGLLSHTMEMAMGTLKRMNGVHVKTAAICMGIGMNAQKSPKAIPRVTDRLSIPKYPFGRLYFSKKASTLLVPVCFFLKTFRIIEFCYP